MNAPGARKAALALATMHPVDQRWMLARLPKSWQPVLGPLLKQARRFASMDSEVLQAVLDGESLAPALEIPSPTVLMAVLDGLSTEWAARAVVAAAPDHTEFYLATCGKQRAESIKHEIGRLARPMPPALARSLANCLNDAGKIVTATEALR